MVTTLRTERATRMLQTLAQLMQRDGVHTVRKGREMLELPGPVAIQLDEPTSYLAVHPARRMDPWVSMCELPWMLCGRRDVAWLTRYLPRAGQFSDDGITWRAAYGPRMRKWPWNGGHVDQLSDVVHKLRADPQTRQAVISLWDIGADSVPGSRDYPCCQTLQFLRAADGRLDMHCHIRSNDVFWGLTGANLPNWAQLQHAVSACVDMPVGRYYHLAGNLHVYGQHFARLQAVGTAVAPLPDIEAALVPGYRKLADLQHAMVTAVHAVEHFTQARVTAFTPKDIAAATGLRWRGYAAQWVHFMLVRELLFESSALRERMRDQRQDVREALCGHMRIVRRTSTELYLAACDSMLRNPEPRVASVAPLLLRELMGPDHTAVWMEGQNHVAHA